MVIVIGMSKDARAARNETRSSMSAVQNPTREYLLSISSVLRFPIPLTIIVAAVNTCVTKLVLQSNHTFKGIL